MTELLKRPSALVPIGMSAAALATVVGYALTFGTARQADEGAAAHIWQLLMVGQLPVAAFFAVKWLPAAPSDARRSGAPDRRGLGRSVSSVVVPLVDPWS